MSKVLIVLLSTLTIAACDNQLRTESRLGQPTTVNVPGPVGTSKLHISEMCYDSILYLVNSQGGMAAKVDYSSPLSPFIRC